MTQHDLERQRLFSIVAYCDEISPIQARVMYVAAHGDIRYDQVRKLFLELEEDGSIERVSKGVYRRTA
jgi:predicted transcriptional regulator of viral defense system